MTDIATHRDCSLPIRGPKGEATGDVRVAVHGDGQPPSQIAELVARPCGAQQGAQEPTFQLRPETQSWGARAVT